VFCKHLKQGWCLHGWSREWHGREGEGGRARAKRLSPEERSRIAKKAAAARWDQGLSQAVCGSPDRPLRIANVELQAYVLEDGTLVSGTLQVGRVRREAFGQLLGAT
jgi:hypothetical protein